jgi:membrane fusion protein
MDFHMSALFRKQAVDAQQQRLFGSISLAQPLSSTIVTLCIFSIATIIMVFLCFSQYARKETVKGYLKPEKGLIKAYTNRSGVVEKLFIQEGSKVVAGQALASIITAQVLDSGEDLNDKLKAELIKQNHLLEEQLQQQIRMQTKESLRLKQRNGGLVESLAGLVRQQKLQKEKIALLRAQQSQYQKLHKEGYISELEIQQQLEKQLIARQDLESLLRSTLQQENDIQQIGHELAILADRFGAITTDIAQQQSNLSRQLSQLENNHKLIINATHSGTITAIQIDEGQTVNVNALLMSLLPEGTVLVAELMLPTRSAGFIKIGDVARLRFDAFPHQRFGLMQSQIIRVDQALITQTAANIPLQLNEPVYRVRSKLIQQSIQGYGQHFPLKSGMLLEADIILDTRSLLDWLLDPIYSLQGRVG